VVKEPFRLLPLFRERVWGRKNLAPYFAHEQNRPIGEAWFTCEENATSHGKTLGELLKQCPEILGTGADPSHPEICPLLVKLLFTRERLSVQVHPDDCYAGLHHKSLGKTEAWYVLESDPPGELGLGFRRLLTPQELKDAALSGEIDSLLDWRPVHSGDTIFVPAGTVHALGAGLTICEIQENSDITYRLYDYGRARELHLEHGLAVSKLGPHQLTTDPLPLADWRIQLLECPYFRIERLRPAPAIRFEGSPFYLLLICTKGTGIIAGQPFSAGQSWMIPAGSTEFELDGTGSEWLLTYTAKQPASALEECA
jgi:mannose-6-phosphate isomerase